MTEEKEIIIDGINVSECENLNTCSNKIRCVILQNDICCSDNTCKGYKNCYYKQLKRLQEKYDTLTNKFFNSETDKTHLKQERDELKEDVRQLIQWLDESNVSLQAWEVTAIKLKTEIEKSTENIAKLKNTVEHLKIKLKDSDRAYIYKSVLEEIKTACQYYIADERELTPEQVIDKINEVLSSK